MDLRWRPRRWQAGRRRLLCFTGRGVKVSVHRIALGGGTRGGTLWAGMITRDFTDDTDKEIRQAHVIPCPLRLWWRRTSLGQGNAATSVTSSPPCLLVRP